MGERLRFQNMLVFVLKQVARGGYNLLVVKYKVGGSTYFSFFYSDKPITTTTGKTKNFGLLIQTVEYVTPSVGYIIKAIIIDETASIIRYKAEARPPTEEEVGDIHQFVLQKLQAMT